MMLNRFSGVPMKSGHPSYPTWAFVIDAPADRIASYSQRLRPYALRLLLRPPSLPVHSSHLTEVGSAASHTHRCLNGPCGIAAVCFPFTQSLWEGKPLPAIWVVADGFP